MRTHRTAVVALTAGLALLGTAGTALAETGGSAPAASHSAPAPSASAKKPAGDGARALCRRAPRIDRRLTRAQKRLDAGAGTRGSVARLEKRVEKAKAAHQTAVETYLNHRLTTRRSLRTTVGQRKADLKDVTSWCATQDFGKKKNGGGADAAS